MIDLFGKQKLKQQIAEQQQRIEELEKQRNPDIVTLEETREEIRKSEEKLKQQTSTYKKNKNIMVKLDDTIKQKEAELNRLDKELIKTNDELLMQSFGLYVPDYKLMAAETYKQEMLKIRESEKQLVKNDKAATSSVSWTIEGSAQKGAKMVKDIAKLLLRSFNLETDDIISKINSSNYQQSLDRIDKSAAQISKLGSIMKIAIADKYVNLKKKEAVVAFNYALAKQAEKEELARIREEQREQEKVRKEIEAQKKKMEKEEQHYNKALADLQKEIAKAKNDNERLQELLNKQQELSLSLEKVQKEKDSVDFKEAHPKAGYVYIISNIGSFGENVYKIGCTRRLEPMDRVDELGDASVPFKFDVHALIFSEDAFALESALHKAFDERKVNLENSKKEFFYVTLDEIKDVVKANFDKTVDFVDIAEAAQYRASVKKREMMKQGVKFDFECNNSVQEEDE